MTKASRYFPLDTFEKINAFRVIMYFGTLHT